MTDADKLARWAEAGLHAEKLAEMDQLEGRSRLLEDYLATAVAALRNAYTPGGERPRRKGDAPVIAALVIAQAVLDSADVCTARLVEAIERKRESGEVSQ